MMMMTSLKLGYFVIIAVAVATVATRSGSSVTAAAVAIDAAPSVVSYQGSSARTHGRLVIAPMGRSLGYVEPKNLNHTVHEARKRTGYEALDISPVYVQQ